jgi:tetratricopeptide (TPR) repeat protein
MDASAPAGHREVLRLIQAQDWRAAGDACRRLTSRHPGFAGGWFAGGRIAMALKDPSSALDAFDRAVELEPENPSFQLHRAQCLFALGRRAEALDAAQSAERCAGGNAGLWDASGTLRSFALDQRGALAAYDRAVTLAPHDPRFTYNRASVRRFVGDLAGAEADYDRVISLKPLDFEAYLNRSELRVQSAARNHVAELEAMLPEARRDWRGEVQIRFALAKEYEDLGEYGKSFEHLQGGAKRRREHLKYEVATDVATAGWIMSAYPRARSEAAAPADEEGRASEVPHADEDGPIFIVGLPRSGSSLVERILSSHSAVATAGELDCFAMSLIGAARRRLGRARIPRQELVAISATLDFRALGRDYLERARAAFGATGRFIDKMPLNFLYCGLIRRALPHARIIHVFRRPMAAGYAMYKTLFKSGYPFSYDLAEIAQYYAAYRRLMDHWRITLPGAVYEASYEALVADQLGETRKLLEYCGLEWEDACVAFHRNPAPIMTASAAQVRRPLYDTSVSQWRHYEPQLAELKTALAAQGIDPMTEFS